ncbi:hypothetical protein [Pseudomonas sp. NFPP07]|nr:hypothetical protein [Pseudomonas sp. NFPP07]
MKARITGSRSGALPGGSSKAVPGLGFDRPGARRTAARNTFSLEVL